MAYQRHRPEFKRKGLNMEDLLSQVIGDLRQESCAFCQLEAAEPWRIVKSRSPVAPFFAVLSGRIRIKTDATEHDLAAGDFLILPRGDAHEVMGATSTDAVPISLLTLFKEKGMPIWQPGVRYRATKIQYGGRGEASVIIIGLFYFGAPHSHPLLAALPAVMTLKTKSGTCLAWLQASFQSIAKELVEDQPGASMAIAKHADLLFAQTLRVYLSQDVEDPEGWLRGMSDPVVGIALAAMHASPEVQWTLQSLAKESGCSRAAFAKRFTGLMHQGALTYLTSWRMALAARYIREGQHTRTEIAGRVGYSTDAFAVAFKRWSGSSPKNWHEKRVIDWK